MVDRDWRDSALCAQVDLEIFFPEKGGNLGIAKGICARCPVKTECLMAALSRHERGIWGGTSERERMKIRTRMAREEAAA